MDDKDESQCRAIKAFVDRNFQKRSVGNHDACFRQPHFHVGPSTQFPNIKITDVGC